MNWDEIISHLPWATGTGLLVAITNYFNNKRNAKSKEKEVNSSVKKTNADIRKELFETDLKSFEILRQTWQDEFNRMRGEMNSILTKMAKLEQRYESLEEENLQLREQLRELRSLHPEMPIPMWLKDTTGKMLSLNQAYEDAFLIPLGKTRKDYVGHYDEDIWGEEIADVFRSNDLIATSTKQFVELDNEALIHPLLQGWKFYKYPVYSQGTFVGIAGFGLPNKNLEI